jgi:hypothetical protein
LSPSFIFSRLRMDIGMVICPLLVTFAISIVLPQRFINQTSSITFLTCFILI